MKTLIIHIGLMKTGSTTIQNMLFENHELLLDADLHYPASLHHHNLTFTPLFREKPWEHPDWSKIFTKGEADIQLNLLENRWKDIFISNQSNLFIISSEWLSALPTNSIRCLNSFVSPFFDNIKVIAYVRHPDEYIPSVVQQDIKNGFDDCSIEELIENAITRLNYSNTLNAWEEVVGKENIIIVPYASEIFRNKDLIDDFFFRLGIDGIDSSKFKVINLNLSIGLFSCILLTSLNKKYPLFKKDKINKERGLNSRIIPEHLYHKAEPEKLNFKINYSNGQVKYVNGEISYVNSRFPGNYKFSPVKTASSQYLFSFKTIPKSFFVELINEYHKEFSNHQDQIDFLINSLIEKNRLVKTFQKQTNEQQQELDEYYINIMELYRQRSFNLMTRIRNMLIYIFFSHKIPFDEKYYIEQNADIAHWRYKPLLHFILHGNYELRKPVSAFNLKRYLIKNPEIIISGELIPFHSAKKSKFSKEGNES